MEVVTQLTRGGKGKSLRCNPGFNSKTQEVEMAKILGITTIIVGLSAVLFACILTYSDSYAVETSSIMPEYNNMLYQDACVVDVTHPELYIELVEVTTPKDGCVNCRYMFRIWNQTATVGTKAYKTSVLLVPLNHEVVLNGRSLAILKLQDYVTELERITYPVIKDEDFFRVDGLCPGCLFADQASIKLVIEYTECSGIRRYECVISLQNYDVTILQESFEPCVDCGC